MFSLVIPIYKNEETIPSLLKALESIHHELDDRLEVIFVVDSSPDESGRLLRENLAECTFPADLVTLSRNFGSFAAIRIGLSHGKGPYFAVMAADLQEPPALIVELFRAVQDETVDVALGVRTKRQDPLLTRLLSGAFWGLYRCLIQSEVPPGGIDVFSCTREVRDVLLSLKEANSTLVGLLIWVGFRRQLVPYERLKRMHGKSAWTLRGRLRYMFDSVYAFSDLPIMIMIVTGVLGSVGALAASLIVFLAWLTNSTPVQGYTPIILAILLSTSLILLGMGVLGGYVWRAFENTRQRPLYIAMDHESFNKEEAE